MSEHLKNDSTDLEKALQALAPVPAPIDRDRLMFQAGQAWRRRRTWLWPAATAALSAAVCLLAVLLVERPAAEPIIRTVYVEVRPPAPQVADPNLPQPDPPTTREPTPVLIEDQANRQPGLAYFRLEQQVLRLGVDGLPPLPHPGPPANELPLTVNRLLGVRPAIAHSPTLFNAWPFSQ